MKNMKHILCYVGVSVVTNLLAFSTSAISQEIAPGKKGLGSWGEVIPGNALEQLHLRWYYNWTPFPKKTAAPNVQFVPMFWSGADVTPANISLVQKSGATEVLGFNEPDHQGQAVMTVNECIDLWPQLMVLKQRLGSPAPADPAWLDKFMAEVQARGLRVDFMCVHIYPDFTKPNAVEDVEKILTDMYQKYGLPIWLTECGTADFTAWHLRQDSEPTPEKALSFVKKLLPMLEKLPFVERYAWFSDAVGDEYSLGSVFDLHTRKLTPVGMAFGAAP